MATEERVVLSDRYSLGPLLGRGGTSDVYDGHDLRLERPVAVKRLRVQAVDDPELRSRFEREARAAGMLAHPNIVEVFDAGESDGRPYLVMERLTGRSLADRLREGPLDQDEARELAAQLLGALAAAHAAGILHRDIKPSNILWSAEGSAKIADFGIAKGMEHLASGLPGEPTATNVLVGTPAYLAPERIEGLAATPRSDLWSVGVVLYEALAGIKPFSGNGALAMAYAVKHDELVPLGQRRPDIDADLVRGVHRALNKRPEQRFASAVDMGAALGAPVDGAPTVTAEQHLSDEYPDTTQLAVGAGVTDSPFPGRLPRGLLAFLDRAQVSGHRRLLPEGWRRPLLVGALGLLLALSVLAGVLLPSSAKSSAKRPATAPPTVPATTAPPITAPTTTGPPPSTAPPNLPPPTAPSQVDKPPAAPSAGSHHHHDAGEGDQGDG